MEEKLAHIATLAKSGQIQSARNACLSLIEYDCTNRNLIHCATWMRMLGDVDLPRKWLSQVISMEPDLTLARRQLGKLLFEIEEWWEAISQFEFLQNDTSISPDEKLETHYYLGMCYKCLGKKDLARKYLLLAMEIDDENIPVLFELAEIHRVNGELEEAELLYRKIIENEPELVDGYYRLVGSTRFDVDDPVIDAMEKLLRKTQLKSSDQLKLLFSLGKAYSDAGEYERSFDYYQKGNTLRSGEYDAQEVESKIDRIIEVFDQNTIEQLRTWGNESKRPIFILGMMRSGTSLTEKILDCHSKIQGVGELQTIKETLLGLCDHSGNSIEFPNSIPLLNAEAVKGMAQFYLNTIDELAPEAEFVVDKMPFNYRYIGFIQGLFPNAKIILLQRNLVDVALSNYFQIYKQFLEYTYSLTSIAHYITQYCRLIRHWQLVCSDKIYTLNYENLVQDPEDSIRDLLNYIGVEFESACLNPHENRRYTKTASHFQVRQPLYRESVERWRRYEPYIGELFEAFQTFGLDVQSLKDRGNAKLTFGVKGSQHLGS